MFHKEFYPTPNFVAQKMAEGYKDAKYVLDPSAGKGDLLSPFLGRYSTTKVFGIECNMELCEILRGNGVKVLGHDFFGYDGTDRFDLVIMNPPFSNGIDHLLHAWEVCKGADVVCLLPTAVATERNTEKRELLGSIIDRYGDVSEIGEVFDGNAERSANVSVSIIRLKRSESDQLGVLEFVPKQEEETESIFDEQSSGLVRRDRVGQVVSQYHGAMDGFEMMFAGMAKIRASVGSLLSEYSVEDAMVAAAKTGDYMESRGDFNRILKKECWNTLFTDGKFKQMISSAVAKDFDKFLRDNENMSFSEENIKMVFGSLFESRDDIFKQAISDAFDYLTKYHSENRDHIEGWKTNDRWKVKRKFILPYVIGHNKDWGWETYSGRLDLLRDVEIALCYLTGKNMDTIDTAADVIRMAAINDKQSNRINIESEFFQITCYKKGTGHFVFKEEELWNRFNRQACRDRMWLPE